MNNTATIIARYVELSRAVTAAEKSGDLIAEEKAMDKFWAFADKYLFNSPTVHISEVRKADRENNLDFVAFS